MARPLRIEYPGAHYHVINRGNAQNEIFHKSGARVMRLPVSSGEDSSDFHSSARIENSPVKSKIIFEHQWPSEA